MNLSNKYNVPQEAIDKMVKDGVISSSWPMYESVYSEFKSMLNTGKTRGQIYIDVGFKFNISESTVKGIVLKMDKI